MPQIYRIGSYIIYFWSNENDPLEPVHVHIAEGRATANATKIWITSSGKALLCNNNSRIPQRTLNNMIRYIEANSSTIINKWYMQFGEISYYYDTGTEAYADDHTGWQDNGLHTGSSSLPYSGGSGSHRCA